MRTFFLLVKQNNQSHVKSFLERNEKFQIEGDFQDLHGNRIPHLSVKNQDVWLIEKLIEKKADFDSPNQNGVTPLMLAVYKDNLRIVELVLSVTNNVNQQDVNGNTAFLYSLTNFNRKIVKRMIAKKSLDIKIKNFQGQSYEDILNQTQLTILKRMISIANSRQIKLQPKI